MQNRNVLVTGASGFIGSWVAKKLCKKYKVIAVVSPYSNSKRIMDLQKEITVVKTNLADLAKVDKLFKKHKPYTVLHLATHGVYSYQQKDLDRILLDNYVMTYNLLRTSVKYNVEKFINTGSVFEYGSRKGKVKESDVNLRDILNKYSAVKMGTTAMTNSFTDELKVLTLRPFTTYGPGEDETRFMAATIKRAKNNESIRLVKGVVRDFVFVEDVAEAYLNAFESDCPSGEVVNIADGRKHTLHEVAKLIKNITKSNSEIVFDDAYVRKKESSCWADITKAKNILNWQPKHSLLMGIKKMI